MKRILIWGVSAVAGLGLAMGSGAQEEPVPNLADVMKQVMGAVGQVAGGTTNGAPYEPVGFRALKEQLPEELTGLRRTSASGEKNSMLGITVSLAEGRYEGDGNEWLTLKISDVGGMGGFAAMAQYGWAMSEYERESDSGFERTTTWKGHKAVEEYDSKSQRGKIALMLEKKIVVDIEARNVPFERLEEARDGLDVEALLGLTTAEAEEDEAAADEE